MWEMGAAEARSNGRYRVTTREQAVYQAAGGRPADAQGGRAGPHVGLLLERQHAGRVATAARHNRARRARRSADINSGSQLRMYINWSESFIDQHLSLDLHVHARGRGRGRAGRRAATRSPSRAGGV